jgi:hypothetical protein
MSSATKFLTSIQDLFFLASTVIPVHTLLNRRLHMNDMPVDPESLILGPRSWMEILKSYEFRFASSTTEC